MALSSIAQLFKEAEDRLKNASNIQSYNIDDTQLLPKPIMQPAKQSDIAQLFKSAEDKRYQIPDTLSISKIEFDDVKQKATLADLDQTIPSLVKGVQYGTASLPQAVGGLIRNWAETSYIKANPSEFVGDPKWEGVDEKIFEAMHTSRYAPIRAAETKVSKFVNKKAQDMIEWNKDYVTRFLPPEDASKVNKFLFDLGAGASSLALSVGLSIATHNPMVGAIAFGGIAAGGAYTGAREAGVDPLKASQLSAMNFATETALEYVGLEFLLTRLPVSKVFSSILKGTSEGMQEFLQETSSNLIAKYGWDTTRKWNQGALRAAALGFILGDAADVVIGSFVRESKAPYNETKKIVNKVYDDMTQATADVTVNSITNTMENERMDYGGELPMSTEGGTALGKAIPAKTITAGKHPGIMITPAQIKKNIKLAEKAAFNTKIDGLINAMKEGKVPPKITDKVTAERDSFWKDSATGVKTYVANHRLIENILGMLDNFTSYGPNWTAIYGGITKGFDTTTAESAKAIKNIQSLLHPLFAPNGSARFVTDRVHNIGNGKFALTEDDTIGVYMFNKNENGLRHLKGMGFTEADIKQCSNIVERSPKLKSVANYLDANYEQYYERLNKIVMKLEGKTLDKEKNFTHIVTEIDPKKGSKFEEDNIVEQMRNRRKMKPGASVQKTFTIERVHSSRPMHLGAVSNFLRYSSEAEFYMGMGEAVKDVNAIFKDQKFRAAVEQRMGKATMQVLDQWLTDVSGSKAGTRIDIVDRAGTFLRRHAGIAMVGLNILSGFRQTLSASQAAAEIGLSHVLNGIQQVSMNPIEVMKFVYANSISVANRQGQFERFMSEQKATEKASQILSGKPTLQRKFMGPVEFMDKWTVIAVWKGTYDRIISTGKTLDGQRIPNNHLHEVACMEADSVIRHTQPFTAAKDLPGFHRMNVLSLMLTQFTNQTNKNINYYDYNIIGKLKAGKISKGQAAYKVLFSYILPMMLMGMIARGGKLPKDLKELGGDMIKYPLHGAFAIGSLVNNAVDDYGNWSVPSAQGLIDIGKTGSALWDAEWERAGKSGIKATAEILGVPYSQVYRTYTGVRALMEGRTDDWKRIIWSEYVLDQNKLKNSRKSREERSGRSTR